MKNKIKKLCIIPARGGSKRLLGKNVKVMGDKPLIYHTIDTALGLFDKVIVTSDSENILQVVKDGYKNYSYENNTVLEISKRPSKLATDTSKVIDTVVFYQEQNKDFDQIWLFLPTCPLRNKKDVIDAQNLLSEDVDSVLSITDYDFPPSLGLLKGAKGYLVAYDESDPWRNGNSRSQDHPVVNRPNGAIYGSWSKSFVVNRNFYKGKVLGSYMERERSIDIDTELDFQLAELIYKNNK
jgi:CMP-N,N'-diacetyllegionaminic acid synthase|tara:strand:- start:1254 stop:1970 length:717 start_codon:yes stop_codon:yes gene_type:complete